MQRNFYVRACWDEDASVFVSESDISGLHIEAASIDEFEDVMRELAPQMILANHVNMADLAKQSLLDLIPSILWQRPNGTQLECA